MSWSKDRAKAIMKAARDRYGKGWEHMSRDQRQNFLDAQLLKLVMVQDLKEYHAAQELVQQVSAEIDAGPSP